MYDVIYKSCINYRYYFITYKIERRLSGAKSRVGYSDCRGFPSIKVKNEIEFQDGSNALIRNHIYF